MGQLVVIRSIPFKIAESYIDRIPSIIYNGGDLIFPIDCLEDVQCHPMTLSLMKEEDLDFRVEVVTY